MNRGRFSTWPLFLLLGLCCGCFLLPSIMSFWGFDPQLINSTRRFEPPSSSHWLGTDELGRDVLLRLALGGQVSLTVAVVASLGMLFLGGTVGFIAGYFGGFLDALLMRMTEAFIAIPKLPLMLLFSSVDFATMVGADNDAEAWLREDSAVFSMLKVVVVVVVFGWMSTARLARAAAVEVKARPYVLAARALGASELGILFRHVLPNAIGPVLVAASIDVGEVVIYESVLSFLGLGVQPPTPSWGTMLSRGLSNLAHAPLLVWLPGLLTLMTVATVNRLGEDLRDRLDPRRNRGRSGLGLAANRGW